MPFRKIIFEEIQSDLTHLILENSSFQIIEGISNLPNLQNLYLFNTDCNSLDLSLNKNLEVININTQIAPYTNFNLSIHSKKYTEIRINNNIFLNLT